MDIVRIAGTSRPTFAAGAIAGVVRDHGRAEVRAIGAGAVNQAVKAEAVAGAGRESGRTENWATGATSVD